MVWAGEQGGDGRWELVDGAPVRMTADEHDKLIDCFRLPSLVHYLVVYPGEELVVHHRRVAERNDLSTAFVREGDLDLSPPGLHVPIRLFFERDLAP